MSRGIRRSLSLRGLRRVLRSATGRVLRGTPPGSALAIPSMTPSSLDAGSVPGAHFLNTIGKPVVWSLSIGTIFGALPNPRSASQFMASLMSSTVG